MSHKVHEDSMKYFMRKFLVNFLIKYYEKYPNISKIIFTTIISLLLLNENHV